jgi:hypothetical protein
MLALAFTKEEELIIDEIRDVLNAKIIEVILSAEEPFKLDLVEVRPGGFNSVRFEFMIEDDPKPAIVIVINKVLRKLAFFKEGIEYLRYSFHCQGEREEFRKHTELIEFARENIH